MSVEAAGKLDVPSSRAVAPRLVCFDLDDTVWFPEMYMLDGAPFQKLPDGRVLDRGGTEVRVYPAAREALRLLASHEAFEGCHVACASRTSDVDWAKTCLKLIEVEPGMSLRDAMPLQEIFPRNKQQHFANLRQMTGVEYHDMLFFDNEYGNVANVSQLGVVCHYCPDGLGVDDWNEGIAAFVRQKETLNA